MKSTRLTPVSTVLFGLAAAAVIYGVWTFFYTSFLKISYPYMVNLGEPAFAQAIRFWHEGRMLYKDIHTPPFTHVPYGPVYPALVAFLIYFFPAPFVGGRLITLLAALGAAFVIALVLKSRKTGLAAILLPALGFLCHPYIRRWGVQVNVDMLGVFFALSAFYFLDKSLKDKTAGSGWQTLGILANTFAFFTKSSMAAVPGAFFWYLVFDRKIKKAGSFFLWQAGSIAAIYLAMNLWTDGNYYRLTTFEIGKRFFFYEFIFRFWLEALTLSPLLVAASVYVFWNAFSRKNERWLGFYLFFVTAMTVSLGKQGSDTNYFLEWCAVSSMALGVLISRLKDSPWRGAFLWAALSAQTIAWVYPAANWQEQKDGFRQRREYYDGVSQVIKKMPGKILSEDMGLLIANGKEIFYEPFPMGQMSYSGVWDPEPILRALEKKEFSMAILYFYAPMLRQNRNFTQAFMMAFNENYRFVGRSEPPEATAENMGRQALFLYVPKEGA